MADHSGDFMEWTSEPLHTATNSQNTNTEPQTAPFDIDTAQNFTTSSINDTDLTIPEHNPWGLDNLGFRHTSIDEPFPYGNSQRYLNSRLPPLPGHPDHPSFTGNRAAALRRLASREPLNPKFRRRAVPRGPPTPQEISRGARIDGVASGGPRSQLKTLISQSARGTPVSRALLSSTALPTTQSFRSARASLSYQPYYTNRTGTSNLAQGESLRRSHTESTRRFLEKNDSQYNNILRRDAERKRACSSFTSLGHIASEASVSIHRAPRNPETSLMDEFVLSHNEQNSKNIKLSEVVSRLRAPSIDSTEPPLGDIDLGLSQRPSRRLRLQPMSRSERTAQTDLFGPDWVRRVDELNIPIGPALREKALAPATQQLSTLPANDRLITVPAVTPISRKRSADEFLADEDSNSEQPYTSQLPGSFPEYDSPVNMNGSGEEEHRSLRKDEYLYSSSFRGGRIMLHPRRRGQLLPSPPSSVPGAFPAMASPRGQNSEDERLTSGEGGIPASVVNVVLYHSHKMRVIAAQAPAQIKHAGQKFAETARPLLIKTYRGAQKLADGAKRRLIHFSVKLYQGTARSLTRLRNHFGAASPAVTEANADATDVTTTANYAHAEATDAAEDADVNIADFHATREPSREAQRHRLQDSRIATTRRSIMRKSQDEVNLLLIRSMRRKHPRWNRPQRRAHFQQGTHVGTLQVQTYDPDSPPTSVRTWRDCEEGLEQNLPVVDECSIVGLIEEAPGTTWKVEFSTELEADESYNVDETLSDLGTLGTITEQEAVLEESQDAPFLESSAAKEDFHQPERFVPPPADVTISSDNSSENGHAPQIEERPSEISEVVDEPLPAIHALDGLDAPSVDGRPTDTNGDSETEGQHDAATSEDQDAIIPIDDDSPLATKVNSRKASLRASTRISTRVPSFELGVERLNLGDRRVSDRHVSQQRQSEQQILDAQLSLELAEHEERVAKERAARAKEEARLAEIANQEQERRGFRIAPSAPVFKPLSAEWNAKVNEAMAEQSANKELATTSTGVKVSRKDFGTLLPQAGTRDSGSGWLNDEIITASMSHVIDYALERSGHRRGKTPKYHAFSSFFYDNLSNKGPESISRWAGRAKIGKEKLLEVESIFIPVNQNLHWTLLVVSPTKRTIEYFDSFDGAPGPYIENTKVWLRQELGSLWNEKEWKTRSGISPVQTNGKDCGVFTVTTAKMVMLNWDPEKAYSNRDMALQRRRIAAELINGGFTGDFVPPEPEGRWE